jgi:hypothetical protein
MIWPRKPRAEKKNLPPNQKNDRDFPRWLREWLCGVQRWTPRGCYEDLGSWGGAKKG